MNCVRGWQIIKVTKSFSSWVSSTHMWPWVLKLLLTLKFLLILQSLH